MIDRYHSRRMLRALNALAAASVLAAAAAVSAGERSADASNELAAALGAHLQPALALPALMRRLQEAVSGHTGTAPELEQLRQANTDEIARIATELAAGAQALAADATSDGAGRLRFAENAHALAADATELARLARARRYAELDAQFERVGHRCAGCHVDFRPPGP